MTGSLRIWTMRTAGLTEADTRAWLPLLDADERARAARFVFERHRMTFIAAHVLARCVLSRIDASQPPEAWRFVPGEHGKPVAWAPIGGSSPSFAAGTAGASTGQGSARVGPSGGAGTCATPPDFSLNACSGPEARYAPGNLTFNLSHTEGLVGLATLPIPGQRLGFDVEPVARPVISTLRTASSVSRRPTGCTLCLKRTSRRGFLRLWTLKEAFIKATGEGLARDLASFWFRVPEATISFVPPSRDGPSPANPAAGADHTAEWQFEQRIVSGTHLAAVGLHRPAGFQVSASWTEVAPGMLREGGAGLPES